jgi:hypothetical protein
MSTHLPSQSPASRLFSFETNMLKLRSVEETMNVGKKWTIEEDIKLLKCKHLHPIEKIINKVIIFL